MGRNEGGRSLRGFCSRGVKMATPYVPLDALSCLPTFPNLSRWYVPWRGHPNCQLCWKENDGCASGSLFPLAFYFRLTEKVPWHHRRTAAVPLPSFVRGCGLAISERHAPKMAVKTGLWGDPRRLSPSAAGMSGGGGTR